MLILLVKQRELTSWVRWCLTIKPVRLQEQSDILSPIYAQIKNFDVNKAGPQAKNIKKQNHMVRTIGLLISLGKKTLHRHKNPHIYGPAFKILYLSFPDVDLF